MNFKIWKIGLIIFCFIFMLIGCVLIETNGFSANMFSLSSDSLNIFNLIPFIIGLSFIVLPGTICIFSIKRLTQIEKQDFFWYKSNYPNYVNNTHVSCFQCGNNIVYTRTNNSIREHYCSACGKTLYYSQSDL